MSAVVASLPAPAVTAPHAILLAPSSAGGAASGRGKLFFHPFFPLLHLMHFPHLFLGAGGFHHGLGGFHHGLGGFHHGLGGFHHGLGGFHHGLGGFGHFPFRALAPEPQTGSSASPEATTPPPVSSTARTEPPARPSGSPGTTRLAPLPPAASQPQPASYIAAPPFKAFITPKRKVVPVYPVPAYPLPALPPLPAYATFDGPLRLTEPTSAPHPATVPGAAESDVKNNLVLAGLPLVPAAYETKAELPTAVAPAAPPAAATSAQAAATAMASVDDPTLPWCECLEDPAAAAAARVELDHSVAHTSEKPSAPSSPGPLAPPPTVAPEAAAAQQGHDSSPELPQRRDKDEEGQQTAENQRHGDTAHPTDSRVLIVVGEPAPAAPGQSERDPEAAEQTTEEVIDQATEEGDVATTTEFATTAVLADD